MRYLIPILFGCLITNAASASTISSSWKNDTLVVKIEGDIQMGDDERFLAEAKTSNKVFVTLNSNGGNILPAIAIGEYIYANKISTLVANDTTCASACALIWLGGSKRYIGASGRVGFHAAYDANSGGKVTAVGNALVGAYLARIGLSDPAIAYVTQAAPTSIRWLSAEDAKSIGIGVQILGVPTAAPAQSAVASLGEADLTNDEITAAHKLSRVMAERYITSGVAGLKASIDACYASVMQSGSQLAAEYCAALHSLSFMFDLGVARSKGYPETEGLTIQDVRSQTAIIASRVNMDTTVLRSRAARMAVLAKKHLSEAVK